MRGVGDELALRGEHGPKPLGHVVERRRDLALLRAPVTSARASRSPASTRRAVAARLRSGRESEPARNQASGEPEDEREGADRDQREHRPPNPVVDRGQFCVTRTAPTTWPLFVTGTAV